MSGSGPTFIIVGAAKSGTTALYRWLQQHPQVFLPENKQPHTLVGLRPDFRGPGDDALNRDIVTDPQRYLALFVPGRDRPARGEASPFYLFYPEQLGRTLAQAYPEMRLIVLLREPVSRAWAGYLHLVRDGREAEPFERALELEEERARQGWEPLWSHRRLGLYGGQLQALLRYVPRERIGLWLYDEMVADPAGLYTEVCRFLGVDDRFVPRFTHHNTGGAPPNAALHRALVALRVPHLAKRLLPEGLAQWVVAHYLTRRPPPEPAASALRAFFAQDQALLRRLFPDKDFRRWGYERG